MHRVCIQLCHRDPVTTLSADILAIVQLCTIVTLSVYMADSLTIVAAALTLQEMAAQLVQKEAALSRYAYTPTPPCTDFPRAHHPPPGCPLLQSFVSSCFVVS